ncbi:MAG: PEGA domain-containing protein, partial [Fibrobacter sp.]|nr:PEGA domain-containing protein [Fibrobacter sp.]
PVGKHSLVLKKKGCYMRKISLQIDSSASFNFTLNRPGSVCFTSEPQGAQIFVNDKAAKKTPFVDSIVKPGDYTIRAELDGYGVSERKITVSSGADDTLKFVFEPVSEPDTAKAVQKEIDPKKQKRVRTIVVAGIFALFGVFLILMESLGEK